MPRPKIKGKGVFMGGARAAELDEKRMQALAQVEKIENLLARLEQNIDEFTNQF